jgi:hypothetical protein
MGRIRTLGTCIRGGQIRGTCEWDRDRRWKADLVTAAPCSRGKMNTGQRLGALIVEFAIGSPRVTFATYERPQV